MLLRVLSIMGVALLVVLLGSGAAAYFYGRFRLVELCEHGMQALDAQGGSCRLVAAPDGLRLTATEYHWGERVLGDNENPKPPSLETLSLALSWSDALRLLTKPREDAQTPLDKQVLKPGFWSSGEGATLTLEGLSLPGAAWASGFRVSPLVVSATMTLTGEETLHLKAELRPSGEATGVPVALDMPIRLVFEPGRDQPLIMTDGARLLVSGHALSLSGRLGGSPSFASEGTIEVKDARLRPLVEAGVLLDVPAEWKDLRLDAQLRFDPAERSLSVRSLSGPVPLARVNAELRSLLERRATELLSKEGSKLVLPETMVKDLVAGFSDATFPREAVIEKGEFALTLRRDGQTDSPWKVVTHRSEILAGAEIPQTGAVEVEARHMTREAGPSLGIEGEVSPGSDASFVHEGWMQLRSGADELLNLELSVSLSCEPDGALSSLEIRPTLTDAETSRLTAAWAQKGVSLLGALAGVSSGEGSTDGAPESKQKLRELEEAGKAWLKGLAEKESAGDPAARDEAKESMKRSEETIKGALKGLLGR